MLIILPVFISIFVIGGVILGLRITSRTNFFNPIIIPLVLSTLGLIISIMLLSKILEKISIIKNS
jgi:hypothetical protein